ncbi:MAG: HAD family phosphatase [Caldilineaceae bacterium]|nr:HAD family phosphatase [Caldilineaceae bacterium]
MTFQEIAAIDLDDTLLRSDGTISPHTLTQLAAWQAAGRQVVIATGRPPRSIGHALPQALQTIPWICYNGAEIRLQDERIYDHLIPATDAQTIIGQILDAHPEALIGVEIDGTLFLNRTARRTTPYEIADLATLRQAAAKILIFDEKQQALPPLAFEIPATAQPLYSARYPHFIQILATDCNKATALAHLVAGMEKTLEQVVAFGDDTNDVEMVTLAGLGIAVENAVAEVKAAADQVTATNDEDGVALALAQLLA